MKNDIEFMKKALDEAHKALEMEEVPIGAVIVYEGKIIGRGHNLKEDKNDPTAHAEIIALKNAAANISSWRLDDCDLYVSIEPCPMCAGAIVQARIRRLIFGAYDPKAGAAGSLYNIVNDKRLNHQLDEIKGGVLADECRHIMKEFFKELRSRKI